MMDNETVASGAGQQEHTNSVSTADTGMDGSLPAPKLEGPTRVQRAER